LVVGTADVASTVTLSATNTFTGGIDLAGGTLDLAAAGAAGGGAITFGAAGGQVLQINAAGMTEDAAFAITGFTEGETIDLTGLTFATGATASLSGDVLTVQSNGVTDTLTLTGITVGTPFTATQDDGTGTIVTLCFCPGTMIHTPNGEVEVENLKVGDIVTTLGNNGTRAITWIGKGKVLATRGRRGPATPVIVCRHALGKNIPSTDLHIMKGHGIYLDGVLIPAEFLVNHKTIIWDDRAQEVELYHIELDAHDILLANSAPAESYRDDGNRWLFQNANEGWSQPPQPPFAEVVTGGPIVDAIWKRLLERAGPRDLPPMTDDPDLHLVVDGRRIDASQHHDTTLVFRLPVRPGHVRIVSHDVVPAELGLARDPRTLGVALQRIAVRQGVKFVITEATNEQLTEGFHGYESDANLRWTNGDAALPAEAFARFTGPLEIVLTLAGATTYPDHGKAAA
ncbi:MAG TPA: Hint domain-containing protein, partial [Rhodopila sp.]